MEGNQWAEETIRNLLLENVKEQRRARRWNIIIKLLFLAYLLSITFYFFQQKWTNVEQMAQEEHHSAVIDIIGPILDSEKASASKVNLALEQAFKNKKSQGVILRINTPGGSPVQARRIFDKIQYLKTEYPDMPVYAAIEDAGVSAGYLIACAADEIYADKTSLVGSIGVIIRTFGAVDAMDDFGIERRIFKAGEHKNLLDMFSPSESFDKKFLDEQLEYVHQQFIDNVKAGRGDRLKEHPQLFSGLFWPGGQAIEYGLIDGFGDIAFIAREKIQAKEMINYTLRGSFLDRFASRIGSSFASSMHQFLSADIRL